MPLSIPRCLSTYHGSRRLFIARPTTFAKWGAFHVCLETIAIPLARLSTFAWYHCDKFPNITGGFGCLPSPISNFWKFRLHFYWLSPHVPWLVGWYLTWFPQIWKSMDKILTILENWRKIKSCKFKKSWTSHDIFPLLIVNNAWEMPIIKKNRCWRRVNQILPTCNLWLMLWSENMCSEDIATISGSSFTVE